MALVPVRRPVDRRPSGMDPVADVKLRRAAKEQF